MKNSSIIKIPLENGMYIFKLEKIIKNNYSTKNKLINDKELSFNSVQRLCTGNITRLDLSIIARICDEYNCKIEDIVEYIPNIN